MNTKKEDEVRQNVKQTNRLGSLSNPRDLSLGGTKQKKVYMPNINAIRSKNKTKEIVSKLSHERIKREYKERSRDKSDKSRYVQSSGVFSEGTSNTLAKRNVSHHHHDDGSSSTPTMPVPKINKNVNWEVNKKLEKEIVDSLLNQDNNSSDSDSDYEPVVLTAEENTKRKLNNIKIEPTVTIKREYDLDISNVDRTERIPDTEYTANFISSTIFGSNKLYNDENPSYSVIKMPDTFPGKGFDDETDELVDFTVKHMHEGQIGKIVMRQSGKMEVMIGDTVYILDSEETPNFIEDIMIMPDQNESYTDPLIGRVESVTDRFVLSPNWKNLFLNSQTK